jgi:hypothetical protein
MACKYKDRCRLADDEMVYVKNVFHYTICTWKDEPLCIFREFMDAKDAQKRSKINAKI